MGPRSLVQAVIGGRALQPENEMLEEVEESWFQHWGPCKRTKEVLTESGVCNLGTHNLPRKDSELFFNFFRKTKYFDSLSRYNEFIPLHRCQELRFNQKVWSPQLVEALRQENKFYPSLQRVLPKD